MRADDEAATRGWLDRIRYSGGVPDFATRRHLIDAQWIPELEQDGLLRDVTRRIGDGAARTASLRLQPRGWERSDLATDLGLAWSAVPHGRHILALPAVGRSSSATSVRAALPAVAILNLIANPTPSAPTLVIHQALLFRAERRRLDRAPRVVEQPPRGRGAARRLPRALARARGARCSGSTCWRSSASSGLRSTTELSSSVELQPSDGDCVPSKEPNGIGVEDVTLLLFRQNSKLRPTR